MAKVSSVTSKVLEELLSQANGTTTENALESFGFFLEDYVIEGGTIDRFDNDPHKFRINEMVASFKNALFRIYEDTFTVTERNKTYFLDFTVKSGFLLATNHPTDPYLPVYEVTTDASGNIATITDMRGNTGYVKFRSEIQGIVTDMLVVDEAHIGDNAVGNTKIKDYAVTTDKMVDESVTTSKIKNLNIVTGKLADLAVTELKLATDSVTTSKIKDLAITGVKLAKDIITTDHVKEISANKVTGKFTESRVELDYTSQELADRIASLERSTQDLEVVSARGGYSSLKDRLDDIQGLKNQNIYSHYVIATEGQTVFNLPTGSEYTTGTNRLEVYVSGVKQISSYNYNETDSTTVTLSEGVPSGTEVELRWVDKALNRESGHGKSHAIGGYDAILPEDIGAVNKQYEYDPKLAEVDTTLTEHRTDLDNHSSQLADIAIQVNNFKSVGVSDDQAIIDAVNHAVLNGYKKVLFKGTYTLTSQLSFGAEVTDLQFLGFGATFNTEGITTTSTPKVVFTNCTGVIFEGFEIVGSGADNSAQLVFETSTKRCICRNNSIRGKSSTEKIVNGIGFYSEDGECHSNYIKDASAFGIIVISGANGLIKIYDNVAENCHKSYEAGYTCKNVLFENNVSKNPTEHHFTLQAMPNSTQSAGVGTVENIKILNNKCYGGNIGVGFGLGKSDGTSGDKIQNIEVIGNEFFDVKINIARLHDNFGNALNNIKIKDNYCGIDVNSVEVDQLLQLNTSATDIVVIGLKVINNHLTKEAPITSAINLYNSGVNRFKDVIIEDNVFDNVGTPSTSNFLYLDNIEDIQFKGNNFLRRNDENSFNDVRINLEGTKKAYIVGNKNIRKVSVSNDAMVVKDNDGIKTVNKGTVSILTGTTSITVNHGIDVDKTDYYLTVDCIRVIPTNNMGSATKFWVSNPTATTFVINVDADPSTNNANFSWQVDYLQSN